MMEIASRPKATDTEDDLLALQSGFLSSGEGPSASVKGKVLDQPPDAKDVVKLSDEGIIGLAVALMHYISVNYV